MADLKSNMFFYVLLLCFIRITLIHYDIAIIGSGPAGLMTAITLVEKGLNIVIIDERTSLGGQYFKQLSSSEKFDKKSLKDYQYQKGNELKVFLRPGAVRYQKRQGIISFFTFFKNVFGASIAPPHESTKRTSKPSNRIGFDHMIWKGSIWGIWGSGGLKICDCP